jgi:excinuclease ABC subunit B
LYLQLYKTLSYTNEFPSGIRLPAQGDQPQTIEKLTQGIIDGAIPNLAQVTGSGKTFTVANVIEEQRPSSFGTIKRRNCSEFKQFFPNSRVFCVLLRLLSARLLCLFTGVIVRKVIDNEELEKNENVY